MCFSALVGRSMDELERGIGATIVRTDFQALEDRIRRDPKHYAPAAAQIFLGRHWAPVIHSQDGERLIQPMRFSALPPTNDKVKHRTTYNARRDSLKSSFWSPMLKKNRGLLVIESFREWVPVAGLLEGGIITLDDVRAQFQKEQDEYRAKAEAAGKKYKPSKAQLTDPRFRQIKIDFNPTPQMDLLVPVIFNWREVDGEWLPAFAMVTDEPIPFVKDAGHDRSPVLLSRDAVG
jgi:hypothetical protein